MTRSGPLVVAFTWLLPFAVAAAGFGVHYALHVPPGPLPPPSPQKAEDERKAADKKKKEEDKKQKEADRKAGKKPAKVDRGPRELPYEPFARPRDEYLLDQLHAYYDPEDFKKEPTFDAWQTAHKPLITQLVQSARQIALDPVPAVNVTGTECHTIRCRFTITGSEHDLTAVIPVLRDLKLDGGSLWHSFVADDPVADKKDAGGRFKAQLTVSFMRDTPALATIEVPGKGRLSVPRQPSVTPPIIPASPSTTTGTTGTTGTPTPPRIPSTGPSGHDSSGAPLGAPLRDPPARVPGTPGGEPRTD